MKAVIAMSGGVDSSVACAILQKQGFEVIGVTLRFFSLGAKPVCCGADESISRAKEVCSILGVRHYVKDARAIFKEKVMENFASSYTSGSTPNPCIECNRYLKFDYLLKIAEAMGANILATGHYAIMKNEKDGHALYRGRDLSKDQSYFLYCLPKKYLSKIAFPLGEMKKDETREIADRLKLPVARSKESKDICFIPDGDYVKWLKKEKKIENSQGYIKNDEGKILGRHNGFFHFTIGQRKNLGISASQRLYVSGINPHLNEVIVSPISGAMFSAVEIGDLNWLSKIAPEDGGKYFVQIRYRHTPCEVRLEKKKDGKYMIFFKQKQFAAARGQSAVFYDSDRVLGGGIITETFK